MIEGMKVEGPLHVVCQCDKCKTESQEPVAWIDRDGYLYKKPPKDLDERHPPYTPLYTHSPQRTWAGLTDDEMQAVIDAQPLVSNINVYFKAIEAKLKEKNNA